MVNVVAIELAGRIKIGFDLSIGHTQPWRVEIKDDDSKYRQLQSFGRIFEHLDYLTFDKAVFVRPGLDGPMLSHAAIEIVSVKFESPLEVVIAAGAGATTLIAFLRMIRDWGAVKRTGLARAEYEEAFYARLSQLVEEEHFGPEIHAELQKPRSMETPVRLPSDRSRPLTASDLYWPAVESVAEILVDVEPVPDENEVA